VALPRISAPGRSASARTPRRTRAFCERTHATLVPDLLSIGWDMAPCPEGPVLVEADVFAGSFEVRQLADSHGLTTREVLRCLAAGA
jgi:hypothetical protein